MDQPTVNHVVENFGKVFQGQSVHNQKRHRQTPLYCFPLWYGDRLGQEVDARNLVASAGEEELKVK